MPTLGVDVSSWQPANLPWREWFAFGVRRAHIRASLGYRMDPTYPRHREQARAAGMQTGAFHAILDHDSEVDHFDPVRQAQVFVSLLRPDDELPAVVDLEAAGIDDNELWAFIAEYERLTDRPLVIYTSRYFWDLLIGVGRTRYSRFPFWVAQYSEPLTLIPDVAVNVAGHQFRFKKGYLPGYANDLDVNWWFDVANLGVRTKLSPHIIGGSADARAWAAPVVKLTGDFGAAAEYAALPHQPLVVGRQVVDPELRPDAYAEQGVDPVIIANGYFETHLRRHVELNPAVQAWEAVNEPVCTTPAHMRWYARFCAEMLRLLDTHGKRGVVGNFSVGVPEIALWADFGECFDAIDRYRGYLGLHEYSEPCRNYDGWYMGRWEKLPRRDIPILIGETGTDSLPPTPACPAGQPWKGQFGGDTRAYADFLIGYDRRLRAHPNVIGACIFTFGRDWPEHNVEGSGLGQMIADYAAGQAVITPWTWSETGELTMSQRERIEEQLARLEEPLAVVADVQREVREILAEGTGWTYQVRVKPPILNVRSGPGVANQDIGDVHAGDVLGVYAELNGWGRIHPTEQRWINVGAQYVERL